MGTFNNSSSSSSIWLSTTQQRTPLHSFPQVLYRDSSMQGRGSVLKLLHRHSWRLCRAGRWLWGRRKEAFLRGLEVRDTLFGRDIWISVIIVKFQGHEKQ